MSIDLNWETVTSGPDGEALAERIRIFIHDKFQTVKLPRFIRSVNVHGFQFGTIPPTLELKDITDPLPDFYEEELDDEESEEEPSPPEHASVSEKERHSPNHGQGNGHTHPQGGHGGYSGHSGPGGYGGYGGGPGDGMRRKPGGLRSEVLRHEAGGHDLGSPFLGTSTPGFLGGSGLSYFQGHMGTGTHTPLAAVAGAHLGSSWMGGPVDHFRGQTPSHSRNPSQGSISVGSVSATLGVPSQGLREKSSVSTLAPTSVEASRPPTRDTHLTGSAVVDDEDEEQHQTPPGREPRVEDVQAVFRIRYSGDVRLNLTAEILLDYPMPSFVGIPLKLNITGMSFDGVGVAAHIRKRVHFCFLSPEDALAAVGPDEGDEAEPSPRHAKAKTRFGGLLQEIKVESEIGERDGRKQSLKNVGKVERFVLEQVRRIFEEEFVYPSFWTFLV